MHSESPTASPQALAKIVQQYLAARGLGPPTRLDVFSASAAELTQVQIGEEPAGERTISNVSELVPA
jgi:hypothetical protein